MVTLIFGRLFPKTLTSLTSFRSLSTRATILSLIERLKLRNGCDYYRNSVIMQKDDIGPEPTRVEIIHHYVKTLADLVGSEEEARMMVYSYHQIGKHYDVFGTLLSEELYNRVEVLPRVSTIIRDDHFVNSKNIDEMSLSMPLDQMKKPLRGKMSFRDSSSPNKG